MARSNAGGGAGSRQVKSIQDSRHRNPRNVGVRPQAVSQIGQSLGNHATETGRVLRGAIEPAKTPGYNPPIGANTNSKPNVHPSGSQHSLAEPRKLPTGRPVVLERGRS